MVGSILFFDGVCNLCNGFINLLFKNGFKGKVAALQGSTAKMILPTEDRESMNSVVYWRNNELYYEGQAVSMALMDSLGSLRFLGKFLEWMPSGLTDWLYNIVAKNRYRIFGQRNSCRMPTDFETHKFLP